MIYLFKKPLKYFFKLYARLLIAIESEKDALRSDLEKSYIKRLPYRNLRNELWARAINSSADFVEKHLDEALVCEGKLELRDFAIKKISERNKSDEGICLEFGVFNGKSINYFSNNLPRYEFHGFDSFEGLNEDWFGNYRPSGSFDLKGKLPSVNENVILHKGYYNETLQPFLDANNIASKIKFIHMDSDTYDSSKFVLETLLPCLNEQKTLILFDDFLSYPNWTNGEYKALYDCKEKFGFSIKYLGFSDQQVLISID